MRWIRVVLTLMSDTTRSLTSFEMTAWRVCIYKNRTSRGRYDTIPTELSEHLQLSSAATSLNMWRISMGVTRVSAGGLLIPILQPARTFTLAQVNLVFVGLLAAHALT
jgi:hypothetical protein